MTAVQGAASLTGDERVRLARLLRDRARSRDASKQTRAAGAAAPASPSQHQLWLADQIGQGGSRYNVPYAVRLTGDIDPAHVETALAEIRRRHEALRTTFSLDGDVLMQRPGTGDDGFRLVRHDLRDLPPDQRLPEAIRRAARSSAVPFDLASGPVMGAELYTLGPREALLALVIHHIATDAWSAAILLRELAAAYRGTLAGTSSTLPEPGAQYADVVAELTVLASPDEDLAYWRSQLASAPEPAEPLPADRPRQAGRERSGQRVQLDLPAAVADEITRAATALGCTRTAVLLAAYAIVLRRHGGSSDLVIGTSMANRPTVDSESLIGYFANTVPLRLRLAGQPSLGDVVRRAHQVLRDAAIHQGVPFARLVAECAPARSAADTPFFRAMFVHQTVPASDLIVPGLSVEPIPLHNGTAKFDLDLSIAEDQDGLRLSLEFDSGRYRADTARLLLRRVQEAIGQLVSVPDQDLEAAGAVTAADQAMITGSWNDTSAPFPDACLHELFEARAEADPHRPAVIAGGQSLTYGELEARANLVAHWLARSGVRGGSRVGISVARSADLVAGLVGIAKAGCAYVPLDPAYPAERLRFMVQDSGLAALIGQKDALDAMPSPQIPVLSLDTDHALLSAGPDGRVNVAVTPADLAYMIYTSGSTGRAKAILADHRGRVSNFTDLNSRFAIGQGDAVLAMSSLSFDMCSYDVFGLLAAGGTIVLPDPDRLRDPGHWAALIKEHRVTVWHSVPALAELLADQVERDHSGPLPVRLYLLGGDWIPVSLPARLAAIAPGACVVALGGATEVSMDSTIHIVTEADSADVSIPYGRPMANQRAYVIDDLGDLAPVGIPAELALGGVGVTWGYHGRPALTAAKFVPNPYSGVPGDRMYRSGDVARWRPDGELVLLGRQDRQVKIRGFRVEPGEVEAALLELPGVRGAAVIGVSAAGGATRLVAFVVPASPGTAEASDGDAGAEFSRLLGARLPAFMIPASYVTIDEIPLTPNGKLDRGRLAALAQSRPTTTSTPPQGPAEQALAGIEAELLGVPDVGREDNFFELGGDSVLAIRLVARAAENDLDLDISDVFERQTVAELALAARPRAERPADSAQAAGSAQAADPAQETGSVRDLGRRLGLPGDGLMLSPYQRHMLDAALTSPMDGLFVITSATPLPGWVRPEALRAAWHQLQERHDTLRLQLPQVAGRFTARIAESPASELIVHDWRGLSPGGQELAGRDLAAGERAVIRPGGPLLRMHLLQLSDDLSVLLDLHHYALFDGWSSAILGAELVELLAAELTGQEAELPPPVSCLRYLDWLGTQAGQVRPRGGAAGHWRDRLAGWSGPTWLTSGAATCARPYRKHVIPFDERRSARLAATAKAEHVTTSSLALAAWSVLLAAATGSDDVLFGVVSAGRPATLADVESIAGQLVNALPLRTAVPGEQPVAGLAARLAADRIADAGHDLVGQGELSELAGTGTQPLFDHVLVFDNYPVRMRAAGQAALAGLDLPAGLDLNLNQIDASLRVDAAINGGVLAFSYDPGCHEPAAIEALGAGLSAAIERIADEPSLPAGELRAELSGLLANQRSLPNSAKERDR